MKITEEHIELTALRELIIARNKLIEDLLVEMPTSFKKALSMRDEVWKRDKEIWAKAKEG